MTKIMAPSFVVVFALIAILLLSGRFFLFNTAVDLSGAYKVTGLTISIAILVAGLYWLWRATRG